MACLAKVPTWRIVKELNEVRGMKLLDPSELSNSKLDEFIKQGVKLLVVKDQKKQ